MPECAVCGKSSEGEGGPELMKCGRCRSRSFCSVACQRSDWPSHKAACRAADGKWYDAHRKCEDGSSHFGALELITWKGPAPPELELGEGLGWGSCLASEGPGLRRRYEGDEFGGDDAKFYEYRPGAYRWTCCGTSADVNWGCDHHGTGPRPCQCDFCHMGRPLPDSMFNKSSMERHGLQLSRGPDRRSFDPAQARIAEMGRSVWGLSS